eukprot:SAG31_NODE_3691_length_3985_cov_3.675244_2_plen_83_part_00
MAFSVLALLGSLQEQVLVSGPLVAVPSFSINIIGDVILNYSSRRYNESCRFFGGVTVPIAISRFPSVLWAWSEGLGGYANTY